MKSGNTNMKKVDRIAASAIFAAALLILTIFGSTLGTATQPIPTAMIALSAYVHPRHERAGGRARRHPRADRGWRGIAGRY